MNQSKKDDAIIDRPARKTQRRSRPTWTWAAAFAVAAGATAHAEPVRFDNTAGFNWTTSPVQHALDIRLDSASQPGVRDAPGVFTRVGDADIEAVSGQTEEPWINWLHIIHAGFFSYLVGVEENEIIPDPALSWQVGGTIFTTFGKPGAPVPTMLPEGVATYLGVHFDPGDGDHYGWIKVTRNAMELDLHAWGYETEPGVPIAAGDRGGPVPTVSEWGLAVMSLSLLVGGTWVLRKQAPRTGRPTA